MKKRKEKSDNGNLSGVESALRRAGRRARDLAAKTGTPLVIMMEAKLRR